MSDTIYDTSEGEFVEFATLDDWRERDKAKDARIESLTAERDALRAKLGCALAMFDAGQDMARASNTLMLMLAGEVAMTKPGIERALRRTLDARNAWDNACEGMTEA